MKTAKKFYIGVLPLTAFITLFATPHALAADGGADSALMSRLISGTWYLALDAGPFDPGLDGFVLSGMAQFHPDRTFMASDAGDFGAQSFLPTFATPQYGSWTVSRSDDGQGPIRVTTLFLEADSETGEALGWSKVQLSLSLVDANNLIGTINAFLLPCEVIEGVPSPVTCPDPIENAAAFLPASPPDVPVSLRRLVAEK